MIWPAAPFIPAGERILIRTRPSAAFIILAMPAWVWLLAALLVITDLALDRLAGPNRPDLMAPHLIAPAAAFVAAALLVQTMAWLSRRYVLTDRRVVVVAGLIHQDIGDARLERIQNIFVTRSLAELLLGLGTLGFATAGADGSVLRWRLMRRPDELLSRARAAIDAGRPAQADGVDGGPAERGRSAGTGDNGAGNAPETPAPPAPRSPLPVIGLTGSIGAGKSAVARMLGDMGCVVSDSDALARETLDTPQVRGRLVEWWGPRVRAPDGRIDRRAVGAIVFGEPTQRARLEALVHPIIRARRQAELAAAPAGARAFIIDAPLLYEAGVDRECDAVIVVDAPRPLRAERLARTRGWSDAELTRRESAQLPNAEKRARATAVIVNDGSLVELRQRTGAALERLLAGLPQRR